MRVYKNLFGDGSKINANEIVYKQNDFVKTIPELFEWSRAKAILQNGWTGDLYYGKNDILRLVYLQGEIRAGNTSAGTLITSIPESFAPSKLYAFPVYSTTRGQVYLGIYVTTKGQILIRSPAAGVELGSIHINGLWRI